MTFRVLADTVDLPPPSPRPDMERFWASQELERERRMALDPPPFETVDLETTTEDLG